jgi:hypothetical protein
MDVLNDEATKYKVMVGLKCYGQFRELEYAIDRAKYWTEQFPGVMVWVSAIRTIWVNGVSIMDDIPPN